MTESDYRLQALFAAAVELPPELRAEMLARECAGAPQLLAELEALLEADLRYHATTAQPIAAGLTELIPSLAPQASLSGARVGPYQLREEIGRGGMGAVYRAERVDGSVAQQVAIKFVRRELLDAGTLKRFQLERQLMATFNHPFIARLLDAAQFEDGTPYYVMEFVEGIPITDYCSRENLDVRARIALMQKVCSAVAEAHRELIVHRDLKPSNILIDTAGNPKLLDFGIAKPLSASLEGNEETGTAYRYFSPQYAAPEQLGGSPVGVACDVYGLGLLLYELLAGCRPFDLTGMSQGQIERLIKEVPPATPSSALARGGDVANLARQLRGDLDGIVMRCLRKLPSERYASVEQLETDLGNYLEGRPVQARGGHGWYRAQKFILRNKAAVSAALLVTLSMLVGIIAFGWQARIANRRAAELEQVSQFQADMLDQVDPTQAGLLLSRDVKSKIEAAMGTTGVPEPERVKQLAAFDKVWQQVNATDAARDLIDQAILKPAVEAIDKRFKGQPIIDAKLRNVLAVRYLQMGLFDTAITLTRQELATRQKVLGPDDPDTLISMSDLCIGLTDVGKMSEAEVYCRETLDRRRHVLGTDHRETVLSMRAMAALLLDEGKLKESEALQREALDKNRRMLGPESIETLSSVNYMGNILQAEGKLSEAESYFREALETRRHVLGEAHSDTLVSINNLGLLLKTQGKLDEAEPYFREGLEKTRQVLGEDHPDTIISILNLGSLLREQGKLDEAEPYSRDALRKSRRVLGDDNPVTQAAISNESLLLLAQGKLKEAESYAQDALEKGRRVLGNQHWRTLYYVRSLGSVLRAEGKDSEAVELLEPSQAAARAAFVGGKAPELGKFLLILGKVQFGLARFKDSEANLIEARKILAVSSYPKDLHDCNQALADLYTSWNKAQPSKGYDSKAAEWSLDARETEPKLPSEQHSSRPEVDRPH